MKGWFRWRDRGFSKDFLLPFDLETPETILQLLMVVWLSLLRKVRKYFGGGGGAFYLMIIMGAFLVRCYCHQLLKNEQNHVFDWTFFNKTHWSMKLSTNCGLLWCGGSYRFFFSSCFFSSPPWDLKASFYRTGNLSRVISSTLSGPWKKCEKRCFVKCERCNISTLLRRSKWHYV